MHWLICNPPKLRIIEQNGKLAVKQRLPDPDLMTCLCALLHSGRKRAKKKMKDVY